MPRISLKNLIFSRWSASCAWPLLDPPVPVYRLSAAF